MHRYVQKGNQKVKNSVPIQYVILRKFSLLIRYAESVIYMFLGQSTKLFELYQFNYNMGLIFFISAHRRTLCSRITEPEKELVRLKRLRTDFKSEKRMECLILVKSKRFTAQKETTDYLGSADRP